MDFTSKRAPIFWVKWLITFSILICRQAPPNSSWNAYNLERCLIQDSALQIREVSNCFLFHRSAKLPVRNSLLLAEPGNMIRIIRGLIPSCQCNAFLDYIFVSNKQMYVDLEALHFYIFTVYAKNDRVKI